MYDSMPWYIAVPLAAVLWYVLLFRVWRIQDKIKDYFAQRRHYRRAKQYMRRDAMLAASFYKTPAIDMPRRMVLTHDNRNRR